MKLSIKKIIAREFLILTTLILFSVLFGLCIYPYNAFRKLQIDSLESEISAKKKEMDSLTFMYNKKLTKQKEFFNESFEALSSEYQLDSSEATWKGLAKSYHSDSIIYFYEKKWDAKVVNFLNSKGFNDGRAFEKFVGENLLNKNDSINYLKSKKVDQNITELKNQSNQLYKKILSSREQIDFSLLIFKILFLIAFPLRFLILGIKWSINTIKQKE